MFSYNRTYFALSVLRSMSKYTILPLHFLMPSEINLHLNDYSQVQYVVNIQRSSIV